MNGADKNPGVGVFDWLDATAGGADGRIYNGDRLPEKWGVAPYTLPAWYPAAGYRGNASSALTSVGSDTHDWSSSVSGAYGLYLYMASTRVWLATTDARSVGFSVRCLHI